MTVSVEVNIGFGVALPPQVLGPTVAMRPVSATVRLYSHRIFAFF